MVERPADAAAKVFEPIAIGVVVADFLQPFLGGESDTVLGENLPVRLKLRRLAIYDQTVEVEDYAESEK